MIFIFFIMRALSKPLAFDIYNVCIIILPVSQREGCLVSMELLGFASNNYFIKIIGGNQGPDRQPGCETPPRCVNSVNIKLYHFTTGQLVLCIFLFLLFVCLL